MQSNPVNTVTNGPKTFGRINGWPYQRGLFLQENVWSFCRAAKTTDGNNEVAVRRGSTVQRFEIQVLTLIFTETTIAVAYTNQKTTPPGTNL